MNANLQADFTLELITDGGQEAGCLLWWRNTPALEGEQVGLIGGFQAAGAEAASELLHRACGMLREEGCTMAIGPMDGSTWRSYRLVTERGTEPPFFMEPGNPAEWPDYFVKAGFSILANYTSALNSDLHVVDPRIENVRQRLSTAGVLIRPIQLDRFPEELRHIYDVSIASFQKNFLYTPITYPDFESLYLPIQKAVQADLVLLAFDGEKCLGFMFAIPDFAQARRGEPITTVIAKSLAVLPGRQTGGLGTLLLAQMQQAALRLGYTRVIHALMHESNNSRNVSGHYAKTMRRYALFSRRLA